MKNAFRLFCILLFPALAPGVGAQSCLETAVIVVPVLSDATRKAFEEKLAEAREQHDRAPNDPDALIWLGRRMAYLGQYREAIAVFSKGVAQFPADARFLRHRGHRLISIRCFDDAIRDLKQAARLTRNRPDEVEPDGLPNARNIPTSSLQSNIWYHLALAYYVKGDFKKALPAWKRCVNLSTNTDGLVSSTNWYYMTLRRLGRDKQAAKALDTIADNLEVIENQDYLTLLQLYQGKRSEADIRAALDTGANALSNATLGYGFGNWLLVNGREVEAREVFAKILKGGQWASFGFIAAEEE
ncbi:MAG: tetratricopeptide repeat protein [Saprospiraceae bacterium]